MMYLSKRVILQRKWLLCTIENIINKISISTYMIKYIFLWHSRLAPIDIITMKRLIKSDLISCDINNFENMKYVLNPK